MIQNELQRCSVRRYKEKSYIQDVVLFSRLQDRSVSKPCVAILHKILFILETKYSWENPVRGHLLCVHEDYISQLTLHTATGFAGVLVFYLQNTLKMKNICSLKIKSIRK